MEYQLADLFESVVDLIPDRTALVADPRRLTYGELEARANQLAHHLRAAGVSRGDHVGCHMPNGTEYVETMIACFKIGAVPVNVNYRYVEEELRYLYANADLKAVVFAAEFGDLVATVAPEVETLEHLLVVGDTSGASLPEGAVEYETAISEQSASRDGLTEGRSPDDRYMLYTGGTTGMPKGVVWRHEDIFFAGMGGGNPTMEPVSRPEEIAERIDPDAGPLVMFAAPPLMHGAAFLGTFIGFFQGYTIVLIRKYTGHGAMELVEREKINTISLVGDAMALPLIDAMREKDYDVSSLIVISTAGAVMSQSVKDRLQEQLPNVMILDSYGSSETGYNGMATGDSSTDSGLKFTVTARTNVIVDARKIAEPGEVGRVAQAGHIPLEYYKAPEKTAETFVEVDGRRWVLTGDFATVDEEGVIHFMGRGSVCINTGGEKVFPEEVEAALKAHPAILDATVVGLPDERWGEQVAAVISLHPGEEPPTLEQVREHLNTRIAGYKCPKTLHVVDEVVRSPAGKADYRWAKDVAEKEPATA
jgi:3-oxocholest-4-en-26-oate---CoA ligase